MDVMHSLLKRQLKKCYGDRPVPDQMALFLEAVNRAYFDADNDLKLIENAMNYSSEELLKANVDIREAQDHLIQSEKLASIGQLAAGVAHEINNPMGFISNNVEMLERYVVDYVNILKMVEDLKRVIVEGNMVNAKVIVKKIEEYENQIDMGYVQKDVGKLLHFTKKGIDRVQQIVMDLRTFAHSGTDKMAQEKIEDVIDGILTIVHNELKYKVELRKDYGVTPLILCSSQRLGQVFVNLLVNACQAIEEKGMIGIKTYERNGYVYVEVRDTGRGIEPQYLNKIFDPFFTTKSVGQGTGLGLSVSYDIIKKHRGKISVESQLGKGTTFTVMMPVAGTNDVDEYGK